MPERRSGEEVEVAVRYAREDHEALAAAARRVRLTVPELVRILTVYGVARLEAGDAELQRAVKGSRDASVR